MRWELFVGYGNGGGYRSHGGPGAEAEGGLSTRDVQTPPRTLYLGQGSPNGGFRLNCLVVRWLFSRKGSVRMGMFVLGFFLFLLKLSVASVRNGEIIS